MSIEKEIFKKSTLIPEKLLAYGFQKQANQYVYSKNILHNTFKITINVNKEVEGHIYDLAFNEEYYNYRNLDLNGEFVSQIREEFKSLLLDIKDKCSTTSYFVTKQANRLTKLIYDKYKDVPEFLWDNKDDAGVFRNSKNKKWYGLIMRITKDKITTGDGLIEILNLKLNPGKILELTKLPGYYKAYHMNKIHWLTIILDDTISDKEIMQYLIESHQFTEK